MKREQILALLKFRPVLSLPAGKIDAFLILTFLLPFWYFAIGMECYSILKRNAIGVVICLLVFMSSILSVILLSANPVVLTILGITALISIYCLIIIDAILLNRIITIINNKVASNDHLISLILQLSIPFVGFFVIQKKMNDLVKV